MSYVHHTIFLEQWLAIIKESDPLRPEEKTKPLRKETPGVTYAILEKEKFLSLRPSGGLKIIPPPIIGM